MGLDMYLEARKYINQFDWTNDGKVATPAFTYIIQATGMTDIMEQNGFGGLTVSTTAVYWRKTNSIHKWFVDNCAHGVDDCEAMVVYTQDLQNLHALICEVIEGRDTSKLPPHAGFFFGSTEVDEYYWQDLERTKKELERLFACEDFENLSFVYRASW
jgi:hypothetical protein